MFLFCEQRRFFLDFRCFVSELIVPAKSATESAKAEKLLNDVIQSKNFLKIHATTRNHPAVLKDMRFLCENTRMEHTDFALMACMHYWSADIHLRAERLSATETTIKEYFGKSQIGHVAGDRMLDHARKFLCLAPKVFLREITIYYCALICEKIMMDDNLREPKTLLRNILFDFPKLAPLAHKSNKLFFSACIQMTFQCPNIREYMEFGQILIKFFSSADPKTTYGLGDDYAKKPEIMVIQFENFRRCIRALLSTIKKLHLRL